MNDFVGGIEFAEADEGGDGIVVGVVGVKGGVMCGVEVGGVGPAVSLSHGVNIINS